MLVEVAGDGQFASIQGCVSQAVNAIFSGQLQGDKIASRTANIDLGVHNLHRSDPQIDMLFSPATHFNIAALTSVPLSPDWRWTCLAPAQPDGVKYPHNLHVMLITALIYSDKCCLDKI